MFTLNRYAQAYIKNSSDLEYWKTLYIKMQEDKGRIPNLNGFNQLIISMLRDGFNPDLVHEIIWVPYDKVDKTLSYPNLIQFWNDIKPLVKKALYEDTKDFLIQK